MVGECSQDEQENGKGQRQEEGDLFGFFIDELADGRLLGFVAYSLPQVVSSTLV